MRCEPATATRTPQGLYTYRCCRKPPAPAVRWPRGDSPRKRARRVCWRSPDRWLVTASPVGTTSPPEPNQNNSITNLPTSSPTSPIQSATSSKASSAHSPTSSAAPATARPTSSPASTSQSCASPAAPSIHSPASATAPSTHSPASATAPSVHSVAVAISPMPVASLMAPSERCSPRITPPTHRPPAPTAPAATLAAVGQPLFCFSTTSCTLSPFPGNGTAICMPGFAPGGSATVIFLPGSFGSCSSIDFPAPAGTLMTVMLPIGRIGLGGAVMPKGGRMSRSLLEPRFLCFMDAKLYS
mmetsp:Transcript_90850/g.278115  ORF Transcript_90850/g.278115 Transcript_90850/m.278115 type:complete len:299 (-) Transcript_90850:421-1317(-)